LAALLASLLKSLHGNTKVCILESTCPLCQVVVAVSSCATDTVVLQINRHWQATNHSTATPRLTTHGVVNFRPWRHRYHTIVLATPLWAEAQNGIWRRRMTRA